MSTLRTVEASTPYPWPYDGGVATPQLALVIAGADAFWSASTHTPAVVARLNVVADAMRRAGALTITLTHPAPSRVPTPVGARPFVLDGALALTAAGLDACYGGALVPELRARGVTHVVVAGFGFEGPVHSTLRGLNDRGFECLVITDACASVIPECTAGAISSIEMSGGIFGAVAQTADLLAALPEPV